jgi:HSP20 family molecular chaperone IbpA
VVFFFPFSPQEDIVIVVRQTSFSLNGGGEAEKESFWPMRRGRDEKFVVVFSFPVVVTDTELTVMYDHH